MTAISYRPGRRATALKLMTVGGLFVTLFNALSFAAEHIHALEALGDAFERHFDLPPDAFDRVIQGLIAIVSLFVCLRVARAIEIWRLTRRAQWRKPERGHAKGADGLHANANRIARSLNIRTLLTFVVSLPILDVISRLAMIEHAFVTVVHWSGPLAAFGTRFWPSIVLTVVAWGCMLLSRKLWLARLHAVDLPDDDETGLESMLDERDLHFRLVADDPADSSHSAAWRDIKQLAETETYGVMGETDLPQVFDWWRVYPRGNWLAEYRGRVVGGIDIWPLKKAIYDGLRAGRFGEEHIHRNSLAPVPDTQTGSYWYVASISLDLRLRHTRYRKAVLAKLVETMLERNLLPSIRAYPAHVLALIWTTQGENIASRSGFHYVGKRVSDEHVAAEPIYEIVFDGEPAIRKLIDHIRQRLAPASPIGGQPPVENPG